MRGWWRKSTSQRPRCCTNIHLSLKVRKIRVNLCVLDVFYLILQLLLLLSCRPRIFPSRPRKLPSEHHRSTRIRQLNVKSWWASSDSAAGQWKLLYIIDALADGTRIICFGSFIWRVPLTFIAHNMSDCFSIITCDNLRQFFKGHHQFFSLLGKHWTGHYAFISCWLSSICSIISDSLCLPSSYLKYQFSKFVPSTEKSMTDWVSSVASLCIGCHRSPDLQMTAYMQQENSSSSVILQFYLRNEATSDELPKLLHNCNSIIGLYGTTKLLHSAPLHSSPS